MRFYTFRHNGEVKVGAGNENGVCPLCSLGFDFKDMNDLIERINQDDIGRISDMIKDKNRLLAFSEIEEMAPIVHPKQDIICLGINYMAHAEESARYKNEAFAGERPNAVYFSKRTNEAIGNGGEINSCSGTLETLDYEAELALIIKKDAKNVKKEDAFNYIFGYTVINDVSCRNIQHKHKQWYFGKSLDTFTAMGPCIVTEDEFTRPPKLQVYAKVNGEMRQNSSSELLIFSIEHVIEELSAYMELKSGTIISMGTPAGVGMGFKPPKFLKPGDIVECGVENIGKIVNKVI